MHVRGEIDMTTAPELQRAVIIALQEGRPLVVTIGDVDYIDLAGFHAIEMASRALKVGQRMALAGSPSFVHHIIRIIEFEKVMPVFDTPEAAFAFITQDNAARRRARMSSTYRSDWKVTRRRFGRFAECLGRRSGTMAHRRMMRDVSSS